MVEHDRRSTSRTNKQKVRADREAAWNVGNGATADSVAATAAGRIDEPAATATTPGAAAAGQIDVSAAAAAATRRLDDETAAIAGRIRQAAAATCTNRRGRIIGARECAQAGGHG